MAGLKGYSLSRIPTSYLLLGGAAGVGMMGKFGIGKSLDIIGNNVANGYQPEDETGLGSLFEKYTSPFVSRYTLDDETGRSVNKQIYTHELDGWDGFKTTIFDGYLHPEDIGSRALASVAIAPHMVSGSMSMAKQIVELQALKKTYHMIQGVSSPFMNAPLPGLNSALEHRVKGGLKYDSKSITGHFISAADDVVSSTYNFFAKGITDKFSIDNFAPSNKGSFIRKHFLYDGKEGLQSEVYKLAAVQKMADIGFRDRFLYSRTFNRIDNLGLSKEAAEEIKKSIVREAYAPTRVKAYKSLGKPSPVERRWAKDIKRSRKMAKLSTKTSAKYAQHARKTISEGIVTGRAKVLADKASATHARDKYIIENKLTREEMKDIAESGAKSLTRRRIALGVGRGVGALAIAAPIITELAVATTRKIADTYHNVAKAYDEMSKANFGYDNYQLNSYSQSERQQAVEAIQNASLNARYLLGNEASMYH